MLRKILSFFSLKNLNQKNTQKKEQDWTEPNSDFQQDLRQSQSRIPPYMHDDTNDYLGMAARANQKAIEALQNNQYDLAWKLEHERIQHYTNHSLKQGFSTHNTLGLLSIVYVSLSNILFVEGKYLLSLAFCLYAIQCDGYVNEGHRKNIRKICKKGNLKFLEQDIESFLTTHVSKELVKQADLRFCQNEVNRWNALAPFYSDNTQEMMKHYSSTPGYLSLVNGISKSIEKALIENEIYTINALIDLQPEDLLSIKGVGKAVQHKITNATDFLRENRLDKS